MKSRNLASLIFMSAALLSTSGLAAVDAASAPSQKKEDKSLTFVNSVDAETMQCSSRRNQKSKHSLAFNDTKVAASHTFYVADKAAASLQVGARHVHFGYQGVHPKGHLYATLGVKGSVITEDNWKWTGLAQVEVPTKGWSLTNDSRYLGGFEGSYALNKDVTVFVGVAAQTGMRATNVQPIIGAQYKWQDWVFHAVYPNPRIIYNGINRCQISFNVNSLFTAVRSHHVGKFKNGVAVFKGAGTEFRLDYTFSEKMKGWISLGRVMYGKVIMGNDYYHKRQTKNITGPNYAQIGVSYYI